MKTTVENKISCISIRQILRGNFITYRPVALEEKVVGKNQKKIF
jgi:hypothetical protein